MRGLLDQMLVGECDLGQTALTSGAPNPMYPAHVPDATRRSVKPFRRTPRQRAKQEPFGCATLIALIAISCSPSWLKVDSTCWSVLRERVA